MNLHLWSNCTKSQHSTWAQWGTEAGVTKTWTLRKTRLTKGIFSSSEPKGIPTSWQRAVLNLAGTASQSAGSEWLSWRWVLRLILPDQMLQHCVVPTQWAVGWMSPLDYLRVPLPRAVQTQCLVLDCRELESTFSTLLPYCRMNNSHGVSVAIAFWSLGCRRVAPL